MTNEVEEAMELLLRHHPAERGSISRVHHGKERYWIATTGDVPVIGNGETPMRAVVDYLNRYRVNIGDRKAELHNKLAELERQEASV